MDDQLRQRLADLCELAAALDPSNADDELGQARIEAYQAGIEFAVSYLDDGGAGEAEVIPFPREK